MTVRSRVSSLVQPVGQRLHRALKRPWRPVPPEAEEYGSLDPVRELMRRHWSDIGHGAATQAQFEAGALGKGSYARTLDRVRKVWGGIEGLSVLDAGCGWGGLAVELARAGAHVHASDVVPVHVEATALRVPSARTAVCDGRELSKLPFRDFDVVFLHSVIEHVVVDRRDYRGRADPVLHDQQRVISEAASLLKPGGRLFLSTGNYESPWDDEVRQWFFHWRSPASQQRILKAQGMSADNYGLLSWPQMETLWRNAGLTIDVVLGPRSLGRFAGRIPRLLPAWDVFGHRGA